MAGDFNKILTTEQYATLLSTISDLVKDMVKGLDPALALGTANIPANALRWSSSAKYWEKYNGSVWSAMSADYAITITGSAAKWTTGRTIALTGDVTGTSGAFDGSGNLSFATSLATVTAAKGGTGLTSYAVGDIVYASGATTLSKLADVATGNVLLSGGVGVAPAYGKVGLTTHVSGTLPAANGGTGVASYAVGDIVYASGATTLSKLADVATGNVLLSGGVGVAPSYGKVGLTTHVSGTLAVGNGGTGGTTAATARSGIGAAASGSITTSGLTLNTARLFGRTTAGAGAPEEISIGTGLSMSGGSLSCTVSTTFASSAENAAGTVQNKAVDPLGIREAFNATGSAPVYACRAWVNFNGTGAVAIRASGNVSSITDNGVGDYTVNFTTAMPDVNYSASTGIRFDETGGGGTGLMLDLSRTAQTTSALRVRANTWNGTFYDCSTVSINVFR